MYKKNKKLHKLKETQIISKKIIILRMLVLPPMAENIVIILKF